MGCATTDIADRLARINVRYSDTIKIIPYADEWRDQMLVVAHEIHAHSLYAELPLDEDKVVRQLAAAGKHLAPDRYFRLAVRDGELLGGFFGSATRTFFCNALLARDMGWWVKESARGGAAAVMLLADFEAWAKSVGCSKVMIGQAGVENIDRTMRLYQNCGYTLTGYNTAKDI